MEAKAMASPIHHQTRLSFPLLVALSAVLVATPSEARRYRRCQDGCCIHEYCAYGLICYPRIHCHFGCPDGYCTGTGTASYPDVSKDVSHQFVKSSATKNYGGDTNKTPKQRIGIKAKARITENYSHNDKIIGGQNAPAADGGKPGRMPTGSSSQSDGICMPLPPCKKSDACDIGHSCSHDFNLGYSVCQYNLDIGTTLCYDTHGNFVATPTH